MGAERVEIGNCIIAGMAEGGTCLEQMAAIVERLRLGGFVIVPRELPEAAVESRPPFTSPADIKQWWRVMLETELA